MLKYLTAKVETDKIDKAITKYANPFIGSRISETVSTKLVVKNPKTPKRYNPLREASRNAHPKIRAELTCQKPKSASSMRP